MLLRNKNIRPALNLQFGPLLHVKHILFGCIFGRQTVLPGAINSLIHES